MSHPLFSWRNGGGGRTSHLRSSHRRGTVVTESTRFSFASSSNKFSCDDDENENDDDKDDGYENRNNDVDQGCLWDKEEEDVVVVGGGGGATTVSFASSLPNQQPRLDNDVASEEQLVLNHSHNYNNSQKNKHQRRRILSFFDKTWKRGKEDYQSPQRTSIMTTTNKYSHQHAAQEGGITKNPSHLHHNKQLLLQQQSETKNIFQILLLPSKKRMTFFFSPRSSTTSSCQSQPPSCKTTTTTTTTTAAAAAAAAISTTTTVIDPKKRIVKSTRSRHRTTTTTTTMIHETKLRAKVRQWAQTQNWESIRYLLIKHPLGTCVIPEENDIENYYRLQRRRRRRSNNSGRSSVDTTTTAKHANNINNYNNTTGEGASRRPSYESYSSGRRSFMGKESAAAAAAIQHAALLDWESSSSLLSGGVDQTEAIDCCIHEQHDDSFQLAALDNDPHSSASMVSRCQSLTRVQHDDRPNIGENILHDICRFRPPLDILEHLLLGLRERYRGDLYTIGKDSLGRTPLHVAVAEGAHSTIIDALVRADPTPASMGDMYCRSPLHLVMRSINNNDYDDDDIDVEGKPFVAAVQSKHERFINHHRKTQKKRWRRNWCNSLHTHRKKSFHRTPADIFQIVQILKEAMLMYPGPIDFNDEDRIGYSPLDYAIEGGMTDRALIRTLIQRNDPNYSTHHCRSLHCSNPPLLMDSNSSVRSRSSTCNSCLEFLDTLLPGDKQALISKIQNMSPIRQKKWMEQELFQLLMCMDKESSKAKENQCPSHVLVDASITLTAADNKVFTSSPIMIPTFRPDHHNYCTNRKTHEEIYHQHLQEYFERYIQELLEEGGVQYHDYGVNDDNGFDIFVDPEEGSYRTDELMNDTSSKPIGEISVVGDVDDCISVLSELMI